MKTLFLHIGMMKTGTTAIQRFLSLNQDKLLEQGIIYRHMPYEYPSAHRDRNGHFLVKKLYDSEGNFQKEKFHERRREGLELVASWFEEGDTVILSDEVIWNVLSRKKRNFLPKLVNFAREHDFTVKVIVYLRRQDEFVDSLYRQWIKMGHTSLDWPAFLEDIPNKICLDYEKGLKKIEKSVGEENLIVRRYEKGKLMGAEQSIYSDFMSVVGVTQIEEFERPEKEDINPSIPLEFAEIKRLLNCLLESEENFGKIGEDPRENTVNLIFKDALNRCVKSWEHPSESFFHESTRAEFMGAHYAGNCRVAVKYFQDDRLFSGENVRETMTGVEPEKEDEPKEKEPEEKDILPFCDAKTLQAVTLFVGSVVIEQQKQTERFLKMQENGVEKKSGRGTGKKSWVRRIREKVKLSISNCFNESS